MDTVKCEIHVRIGDRYVTHTLIQITNYVTHTLIYISMDTVDTVSIFFQITPHSLIYSTPSVHFYKTLKTFQTMYKTAHFELSEMTYKSERREYLVSND